MNQSASLDTPVQFLKGVGPARAKLLEKLGLRTVEDLLFHFPRAYMDRTRVCPVSRLTGQGEETIEGEVRRAKLVRTRRGRPLVEAVIGDRTGDVTVTWFNLPFLAKDLEKGTKILLCGRVEVGPRPKMIHPEFEILREDSDAPIHTLGLIPQYPLTEGIGQRGLRRLVRAALEAHGAAVPEILPETVRRARRLPERAGAVRALHAPEDPKALASARERMAYEELFLLQALLAARRARVRRDAPAVRMKIPKELDLRIRARFPVRLTGAQERVIGEIRADLGGDRPMYRLLQGDVGSGKTLVAAYALLAAVGNRAQAALMAPTEILAEQHRRTFARLLAGSKVRIGFLGGGLPSAERKAVLAAIAAGGIDLVIGTHAVVQESVRFRNLGLAVIDEQHKFGVRQRTSLQAKGSRPHLLVMTATPIPRTLALTLYGDLDVSVIDEMPPGRRPVKTLVRPRSRMRESLEFVREQLRAGDQAYFVYPLIDDSDDLPLKSATRMAKELQAGPFREFRVGLLHGGMKGEEKESVLESFRRGATRVLVSTLVIEVGIDVPRATILVVEHAERYGLSQLHQLRGRVGRPLPPGAKTGPCYCILFGNPSTPEAQKRLRALAETGDGFKIAEEDLRIRGPGEMIGLRQSGIPEFRVADPVRDAAVLMQAREDAGRLLAGDPGLKGGECAELRMFLKRRYGGAEVLLGSG